MIIEGVRGASQKACVRFGGIDRATLWRWEQQGRAGESEYAAIVEELDRAEAEFEAEMVAVFVNEARTGRPGAWQAAMTILERKHPEEYGQRTNIVVSGDRPILFEHHHVDVDAELARIQERLGLNGERPALPRRSAVPSSFLGD